MLGKVLIIEDEERIRRVIKDYLEAVNIIVFEAENGHEGFEILDKEKIDIVLLDIMLEEIDGWDICEQIRKTSDVTIVMLTAKSQEDDKLLGYSLGADDYITKPFSAKVLQMKVVALLSRIKKNDSDDVDDIIEIADKVKIDKVSRFVYIDDEEVKLTTREFDLLLYLIGNKNMALSREQIIVNVWGADFDGLDRTVDTTIKRLQAKVNKLLPIEAVRGYGYRFEV